MTIYGNIKTAGGNLEMAVESALGTPGTYYDFRHCDDADPAFPLDTREIRAVSTKGNWSPADREPQLSYEKFMEGAGTVSCYLAGCASGDGTPQTVKLFEAMGCTVAAGSSTPTTVDAYTGVTSWSSDTNAPTAGRIGAIENSKSDAFLPYLTYTNSGTAAYDIVPTMGLYEASINGAKLYKPWTITPPLGTQVSSSKTLAFRMSSYFVTSTETGSCWVYTGCAPSEIKPIVFEPGSPLKIEAGLHIADRVFDQTGIDLTAQTYIDSVKIPFVDGNGTVPFRFGFCDLSAMPIAATRTTGLRKATWNPGIKTIPIMESGTTTAVNGLGGYLGQYTGSTIELIMDVNKDWWTALESSGSQTAKYIELTQAATGASHVITSTGFGLYIPKAYFSGKPVADLWSDKDMTITVTLEAASAGMTATSKTDVGNQPWYFGITPSA